MATFTYTTRAEIEALLPAALLRQSLDQYGNGEETGGVFAALAGVADDEVEALVQPTVDAADLAAAPAVMRDAARKILCDLLYRRMPTKDEENPWNRAAKEARDLLRRIGLGKVPLSADEVPSGAAISDDADSDWTLENMEDL